MGICQALFVQCYIGSLLERNKMKTIILCGGQGTRLKEETEYKPKPMVYVGDKPIIWHIMKMYSHWGFNEFILALGYKADYIKDFFLKQKAFTCDFTLDTSNHETKYYLENRADFDNFKITFVDTGLETLPGERIIRCRKYLPHDDQNFMVVYGDGVSDININKLVEFHLKQNKIATIAGVHPTSKYGIIKSSKTGVIEGLEEKPMLTEWVNGGFMVFKRDIFRYLRKNEYEHPALKRLIRKKELLLYQHSGFWYAVDTNKELEYLNDIWAKPNAPWKVW